MAIPPKAVRDTARRHANGEAASLVPRQNYGLAETSESLPVLKAFREFVDAELDAARELMESERRAARNRLVTLSLFFVALVIFLIAGALFVGMTFFDQVEGDINMVQGQSEQTRRQLVEARRKTDGVLAGFGQRTDVLKESMIKDREAMAAAHAETTSLVSRIGRMSEVIELLERENASLREDLGVVSATLPEMTNGLNDAVAEIQRLRELVAQAAERGPATQSTPATGRTSTTIVASLILPGAETSTAWHFPIPE